MSNFMRGFMDDKNNKFKQFSLKIEKAVKILYPDLKNAKIEIKHKIFLEKDNIDEIYIKIKR